MKQNVFRFEISVNDIVFVHVFDCIADLLNILFDLLFGHFSILF